MAEITDDRLDELLGGFRADVPEPSTQTIDDLRADLLAATVPPEVRPLAPDAVRPLRPTTPRGRRRALIGLLAAAAVVAALAIGAVAFLPHADEITVGGSHAVGLPPMPDKPINRAGELSRHVTMPKLGPGQYLYLRDATTQYPTASGPGGTVTGEQWVTYDPKDQWREHRTSTGEAQGGTDRNQPEDWRGPGTDIGNGNTAAMRALPSDPAQLYRWLAKKFAHDQDAPTKAVNYLFHSLYVDYSIPAATKAAMYEVLGYLPGVQVTRTTLPDHTQVTVLTRMYEGLRVQLFVDPRDGHVAGYRDIAAEDQNGVKAGYVILVGYNTMSVVDSIESRP
ncbi:hypothetical protein [Labedaea rhizosphaerae]|uniref:CU044_5270 family protein n=1 Tax=Labedaea rhizosphaerae TaxID=598644 RepID=A0A4V3D074_LABRH|nr:hypothetical protein [Labedaea rhizosphaerae]TDQ04655.1 hypothetical protein EV186_101610 [Labedaea rhizosphaerae]